MTETLNTAPVTALPTAPVRMTPLFDGDSIAKRVVEVPITPDDVRKVPITDETHNMLNDLRARMTAEYAQMTDDDESANRRILKGMVDDGFTTIFDAETAAKIYDLAGSEVMSYTTAYIKVLEVIGEQFESRANSEVFAKYAPHLKK